MKKVINIFLISTYSFSAQAMFSRIITTGNHYQSSPQLLSCHYQLTKPTIPYRSIRRQKLGQTRPLCSSITDLNKNAVTVYDVLKNPHITSNKIIEQLYQLEKIILQTSTNDYYIQVLDIDSITIVNNDIQSIKENKLISAEPCYTSLTQTIKILKQALQDKNLQIRQLFTDRQILESLPRQQQRLPAFRTKYNNTISKINNSLTQINILQSLDHILGVLNNPAIGGLMLLSPEGKTVFKKSLHERLSKVGVDNRTITSKIQALDKILANKKPSEIKILSRFKDWTQSLEDVCTHQNKLKNSALWSWDFDE